MLLVNDNELERLQVFYTSSLYYLDETFGFAW